MKKESFSEQCYALLRKVPRGKITTYKALAKGLNCKAYRAVGTAMNKNPYSYYTISQEALRNRRSVFRGDSKRNSGFFLVPCHRVINSNGNIGGFAYGVDKKIKMLKAEGIPIKDNKIQNMKKYLFEFKR